MNVLTLLGKKIVLNYQIHKQRLQQADKTKIL